MTDIRVLSNRMAEERFFSQSPDLDFSAWVERLLSECAAKIVDGFRKEAGLFDAVIGYDVAGCILAWQIGRELGKSSILAGYHGGNGNKIINPEIGKTLKDKKVLAVGLFLRPDDVLHECGFSF